MIPYKKMVCKEMVRRKKMFFFILLCVYITSCIVNIYKCMETFVGTN